MLFSDLSSEKKLLASFMLQRHFPLCDHLRVQISRQSTIQEKMVPIQLPQYLVNVAQPGFCETRPCTNNTVHAGSEIFYCISVCI